MSEYRRVGVIGGMGPEATLDLLSKIIRCTPANCDQEHIPLLVDICPQIPDRTKFLVENGEDPLPWLLESGRRLAASDIAALCMPCNTAHYFAETIQEKLSVPLISMIESVLAQIQRDHPEAQQIGLMATSGTLQSRVYHDALQHAQLEIVSPPLAFQTEIMEIIYAVKSGRKEEVSSRFQVAVDELTACGADLMIAGCTELPLLLPYVAATTPIIDTTQSLAERVVAFALTPIS